MQIEKCRSRLLRETLYRVEFPNGLKVVFVPRTGAARQFGMVGVRFGSTCLTAHAPDGATHTLPVGTAHFLEHMMFIKPGGDISTEFTRAGGSCNAATDYTSTIYSFSCWERFPDHIGLLARLVRDLRIDPPEVDREREVIGQELKMYLDAPDVKVYQSLMEGMYRRHPVRHDIAGTIESIRAIDHTVLHTAHALFYAPGNLVLALAGDAEPNAVFAAVREHWVDALPARAVARKEIEKEPREVAAAQCETTADVSIPKVLLGIKDPHPARGGTELVVRDGATSIALDAVLGLGSELYARLYRKGWLDDSFGASTTAHPGFSFTTMGGDTEHPEALRDALRAGLTAAVKRGVRRRDFERLKRRTLGRLMMRSDDLEGCAATALLGTLLGFEPFDLPELLKRVTLRLCNERLEEHLAGHPWCWSVVRPVSGDAAHAE